MALAGEVAGLALRGLHRWRQRVHQRRQMAGQGGVVLDRFDGGIDGTAGVMAEHHEERHVQHCHSIFETGDGFLVGEIAGVAADEHVAARARIGRR